jgi:hypothetical protein
VIDTVGDTVAVTAFDVATGVCVTVSVADLVCVTETVGEILFRGIVTVVKELLGVNDVLGVFEIGEPDGDNVEVIVVVIDPYDEETRGLAVLVIGDCDNVFVALTVTDVLEDCTRLNVFRGEDVTEGNTVLVADTRADEVDEVIGLAD